MLREGNSKFGNQITEVDAKSFGDLRQCFHRNLVFSPLDIPDVISSQIRLFRKLLLRQAGLYAFAANFFTEHFG